MKRRAKRRSKRVVKRRRNGAIRGPFALPNGFFWYTVNVNGFPETVMYARNVKQAKDKWWFKWKPPFLGEGQSLKVKKIKSY